MLGGPYAFFTRNLRSFNCTANQQPIGRRPGGRLLAATPPTVPNLTLFGLLAIAAKPLCHSAQTDNSIALFSLSRSRTANQRCTSAQREVSAFSRPAFSPSGWPTKPTAVCFPARASNLSAVRSSARAETGREPVARFRLPCPASGHRSRRLAIGFQPSETMGPPFETAGRPRWSASAEQPADVATERPTNRPAELAAESDHIRRARRDPASSRGA